MKTAISIPDAVFEAAEETAKSLGLSPSEFYAAAVRELIDRYRREDVTARLNAVYADDHFGSELDSRLQTMQTISLEKEDW